MKVSDSEGLLFKRFKPEGFEDIYFKGLLTEGILSDSRYMDLLSFCLKKKRASLKNLCLTMSCFLNCSLPSFSSAVQIHYFQKIEILFPFLQNNVADTHV